MVPYLSLHPHRKKEWQQAEKVAQDTLKKLKNLDKEPFSMRSSKRFIQIGMDMNFKIYGPNLEKRIEKVDN